MWVMIGHDCLNLDFVAAVRFSRDQDESLTANVELAHGVVKHYQGHEAEILQEALDALTHSPDT